MKTKKAKNFVYEGLGFPVLFKEVAVKEVLGEMVPDVNHRHLQDEAFRSLLTARFKLSGAHLNFVRHYMGLKQDDLAQRLGLSGHSMISKWEKKRTAATGMTSAMEAGIRMLMCEYLNQPQIAVKEMVEILAGGLGNPKGPVLVAA